MRRSVPRITMCAVKPLRPSLPIGSSAAPARTNPSMTTDGLEKFSFTSTVMPLAYSRRTMLSGFGNGLLYLKA